MCRTRAAEIDRGRRILGKILRVSVTSLETTGWRIGAPSGSNSRTPGLYSECPNWKWVNDRIVPTRGSAIVLIRQRAASVLWVPTLLTPRTELLGHRGGPTPIRKNAPEKGSVNRGREGRGVNDLSNEVWKFLTQARADYLSGIPEGELRRISCDMRLGSLERADIAEEACLTTYQERPRGTTAQLQACGGTTGGGPLNTGRNVRRAARAFQGKRLGRTSRLQTKE